jgi:hypothetical protein
MSNTGVEQNVQKMEEENKQEEDTEIASKLRGKPKSGRGWKEAVSRLVLRFHY